MVGSSAVKQTPVNLVPFSLSGKLCFWRLMCYDFNLCDQKHPACSSLPPWGSVQRSAASQSSPTQRWGTDQYFFLRTEKWRHSRDDDPNWMLEPELIFCSLAGTGRVFMLKVWEGKEKKARKKKKNGSSNRSAVQKPSSEGLDFLGILFQQGQDVYPTI